MENPIGDVVAKHGRSYKFTDQYCDKHEVQLVQPRNLKPFCPECAVINTAHSEAIMMNEETEKAKRRNSRWLRSYSFVTGGERKLEEMMNMTFDNFHEVDQETKINKKKAQNLVNSYFKGNEHNAVLAGEFGTGKTHLAMAILNKINEVGFHKKKDVRVLFVETYEMMERIYSSYNDDDSPYRKDRVVAMLIEADLLVLDDIGAEVGSMTKASEANNETVKVLTSVMRGREYKPTIITSNLDPAEMKQTYDGRFYSRLMRGVDDKETLIFAETVDKRRGKQGAYIWSV